jgi:hypothetical protein
VRGSYSLGQWDFAVACYCYVLAVFVGAILLRAAQALLKALQDVMTFPWRCFSDKPWSWFWPKFREHFCASAPGTSDAWHGFFVGLLELLVFPVLMATGNLPYIGAWLSFKVVAQWRRWGESRTDFNRFLILNGLVLLLSYWFARRFIYVPPGPPVLG